MAHTRKAAETNTRNAFETTLSGALGATDTTLNLTSTTGLVSPCYLVIDPDETASREYIFIDGTGKWKNFIGTKYKYAINYLDNAIFNIENFDES